MVVLELEGGPITSLTLRLLYRRRSNRQAAAMVTIQVFSSDNGEILARPSRAVKHEEAEPMVRPGRAKN
jgi:hypothetical protein